MGKSVAKKFGVLNFKVETSTKQQYVIYPEVTTRYGALTPAGDTNLQVRLVQKFATLKKPGDTKRISLRALVDYRVLGIVPLEIYKQTKDAKFLKLGKNLAVFWDVAMAGWRRRARTACGGNCSTSRSTGRRLPAR